MCLYLHYTLVIITFLSATYHLSDNKEVHDFLDNKQLTDDIFSVKFLEWNQDVVGTLY